jgi:exopolysaccharide biosynthesis protein
MKKKILVMMLSGLFLVGSLPALKVYAQEPIYMDTIEVSYSGGTKSVRTIFVDLNNKDIKIYTALANNQICTTAPLSEIIESKRNNNTKLIAGMNGNYFDAYTGTAQAYGGVIDNGVILHKDYNSTIFAGFDANKKFYLGDKDFSMTATIEKANGEKKYSYIVSVNNSYGEDNMYTSSYGEKTPDNTVTAVVVQNGKVTNIINGQADIPKDDYVITVNDARRFAIGDKVTYDYVVGDTKLNNMVAAGPVLIKNGVISDSFDQPGSAADFATKRAMRNFIGVTADNQAVMGNVSGVSLPELAEITQNMGLINAFNMDGGASAGLYYDDGYFVNPGRNVAVGLVFALEDTPIINVLTPFNDVNDTDWYTKNLVLLLGKNIVSGYEDGSFRPNDTINADAFIKLVVSAIDNTALKANSTYWAQPYIDKAFELGWIKKDEIAFTQPITRQQMAVIVSRALNEKPKNEKQINISDWNSVKDKEELSNVYSLGILSGYEDNTIRPNATATRAEASAIIARMIDKNLRAK